MKSTSTHNTQPWPVRVLRSRWFYLVLAVIYLTFTFWFNPSQLTTVWSTARMAKGFWDNFGIVHPLPAVFRSPSGCSV